MAAQQGKVLRVAVVKGGQIIDDRVLAPGQPLTVGAAPPNAVVLPRSSLPASLRALEAEGRATRQGDGWVVAVGDDDRGKLPLGDVTLLWKLVVPPAPALPRSVKGNHFRSMDRLFVSVLAISFLLHSGVYVALARTELPKEVTLEEIPERFARVLIPEKLPAPPKVEERKREAVAEAKAEPNEEQREAEKKPAQPPEQVAAKKAARAAAVAKAVQSKGILKVLGALGPGSGSGAVADVFGKTGGMNDVATALSGAGGVALASDPGAGGGRKGGGQGGAASIGALATTGGGAVGYGAKAEVSVKVSGSVQADAAEVDSAEIDPQKLASFVRARMGLIKSCYENALKRNPGLKGKVSVRFTILETGGLADIAAAANTMPSPEVSACIVATMRTWRTQFKPSGPVTVEYPFVFSPVN